MARTSDVHVRTGVLALGLVLLAAGARPAFAQQAVVSGGVNARFVSGSFGSEQTTHLFYVPAVLRVEVRRFEVAGYFPYLTIDDGTVALSQGGFVPMRGTLTGAPNVGMPMGASAGAPGAGGGIEGRGMGGGMMGGGAVGSIGNALQAGAGIPASLLTSQSGFGDISGSVGYRIVDDAARGLQLVLGSRFKLPTASAARGLGTGKTDVGVTGTVRKRFDAGWVYGEAGYLFVGDPTGIDLRNAALWSAGGGRRVSNRLALIAMASGNTALLREFKAPVEVGAGVGVRVGNRLNASVVPTFGLSDASPRYGITVGLSSDIVRR